MELKFMSLFLFQSSSHLFVNTQHNVPSDDDLSEYMLKVIKVEKICKKEQIWIHVNFLKMVNRMDFSNIQPPILAMNGLYFGAQTGYLLHFSTIV